MSHSSSIHLLLLLRRSSIDFCCWAVLNGGQTLIRFLLYLCNVRSVAGGGALCSQRNNQLGVPGVVFVLLLLRSISKCVQSGAN